MLRTCALLSLTSASLLASAQTSTSITVPGQDTAVLSARGEGVQIYTCAIKDGSAAWTLKAPEAKLFDTQHHQIGTHSAGPVWHLNDGSEVKGKLEGSEPHPGTIPWLLLTATSTGTDGKLKPVNYVRRTDTKGGVAPGSGCDQEHMNAEQRIEYSATYSFYRSTR